MTQELHTSDEWQKIYSSPVVLDPDGWDRTNFHHSWFEEEITLEEYRKRVFSSTAIGNVKNLDMNDQTDNI